MPSVAARLLRAAVLAAALALPAAAQDQPAPAPSPVLTLNQDRLFAESLWGKRVTAEIEAASAELAAENRRIEGELTAEEKALTDRRATMPPEEFRKAADDFDTRVVGIRSAQDAKTRALNTRSETERQEFFKLVLPVISDVLQERGAVAVLDSRAIFVSSGAIDITDTLIAEIDRRIGAGPAEPAPAEPARAGQEPAPAPAPAPSSPDPAAPAGP